MQNRPFIVFFFLFYSLLMIPFANAQKKRYLPPPDDRHTQQTRVQTARTPRQIEADFEILAPQDYIAATFAERPVFFLKFHKLIKGIDLDITLERNGELLTEYTFPVERTGIFPLPLPITLPPGRYVLAITYDCPSDCKGIRIAFDRENLTPEQGERLRELKTQEERAAFLAEIGHYYDSIQFNREDLGIPGHYHYDPVD